jgi:transposase
MRHGAIDLHKKSSRVCLVGTGGGYEEFDVATERDALAGVFGKRARCKLLIESSTESEWVARLLEELGHEVIVGDPNFQLMYASRSKRIKTDRRDGRALCDACRLGNYRAAHRTSGPWRAVRQELSVRDALVRSRTRMINVVRSLLRQEGVRLPTGSAEDFAARFKKAAMPTELSQLVHPLVRTTALLSGRIQRSEKRMTQLAAGQERVRRLMTAPCVGVVTAMAFAAVMEPAGRFGSGEQVGCYLGLVPSEDSSSERRRLGRITKTGDKRVRWLLVETGWRVLRSSDEEARPLRRWGEKIAQRSGRPKAAVALARKMGVRLWAMDRDKKEYQACPRVRAKNG